MHSIILQPDINLPPIQSKQLHQVIHVHTNSNFSTSTRPRTSPAPASDAVCIHSQGRFILHVITVILYVDLWKATNEATTELWDKDN